MEGKVLALSIYSIVGLFLVILPFILTKNITYFTQTYRANVFFEKILYIGIGLLLPIFIKSLLLLPYSYIIYSFIFSILVGYINNQMYKEESITQISFAAFLGLLVTSSLPWWLKSESHQLTLTELQSLLMLLITMLSYWMLTRNTLVREDTSTKKVLRYCIYGFFGVITCLLTLSVGQVASLSLGIMWHHWGAYIGPAQLINAGVLPLHDIPLQYGLGPTLLSAWGCQIDCAESFYWITALSTILMISLIGFLALQFNRSKHPLSVLITLTIVGVTCLFWTAYPANLLSPLTTPSTSGLRFLPSIIFLTILICYINRAYKQQTLIPFSLILIGHSFWLICILWSPEAGIHASMLWIPYFIWERSSKVDVRFLSTLLRALVELSLVLIGGLGLFAILFRILLGDWPTPIEYIEYIIHPPGPLPVNPYGPIWFSIACFLLYFFAFSLKYQSILNKSFSKSIYLVALLAFSTFSYYLGRSHDNNILNLLPYLALLLMAICYINPQRNIQTLANTMLASLIGWIPLFGLTFYNVAIEQGQLLVFTPSTLTKQFSSIQKPTDVTNALNYIHSNFHESVEIYDNTGSLMLNNAETYQPWNALHGPENFAFIPSRDRQIYLKKVAKRLNHSGWILYKKTFDIAEYLIDYESVYKRTHEINFGDYNAIRFIPIHQTNK